MRTSPNIDGEIVLAVRVDQLESNLRYLDKRGKSALISDLNIGDVLLLINAIGFQYFVTHYPLTVKLISQIFGFWAYKKRGL